MKHTCGILSDSSAHLSGNSQCPKAYIPAHNRLIRLFIQTHSHTSTLQSNILHITTPSYNNHLNTMSTFIDHFWASRIVPPSMPYSHPSLFAKPPAITIASAVTSSPTCPSLSSSRSASPTSGSDTDDDDKDPWRYGRKAYPICDPPAVNGTLTQFCEIRSAPLVRDPKNPSRWIVGSLSVPLDKFVSPLS